MSVLNWLMNIKPIFFSKIQKSIFNIKLQLKLAIGLERLQSLTFIQDECTNLLQKEITTNAILESLKPTKYRFFMFVLALIPQLVKSQELSPTTVWRCVGSYNRIKYN